MNQVNINIMNLMNLTILKLNGHIARLLCLPLLFLPLLACNNQPKPTILTVQYDASTDLNPDIYGKPAPLVVAMYQLKSVADLEDRDFYSLDKNNGDVLGEALVAKDQVEIRPNQTLTLNEKLSPEANHIAFVASYRDIDNATWRLITPIEDIKSKKLTIVLGANAIKLQPKAKESSKTKKAAKEAGKEAAKDEDKLK